MIEHIKFFFSAPLVILLTIALFILFFNTGAVTNPHDVIGVGLKGLYKHAS